MLKALLAAILALQVGSQNGTISGRVLSGSGSPVAGIRVFAIAANPATNGAHEAMLGITQSDESGRYRLENIPPGQYWIAVGRPIQPTYYPNAFSRSEAKVISVSARAAVSGLDISMVIRPMEFVSVPQGEFEMGCMESEAGCTTRGQPSHHVTISKGFSIGKYEVTQAQWEDVMGKNPSKNTGQDNPVDQVSWDDAQEFVARLNLRRDGYRYRLPTEAEWEYAARAGLSLIQKDQSLQPDSVLQFAWVMPNASGKSHPVGELAPNLWGLYDMLGNVSEWVQDFMAPFEATGQTDPKGPDSGDRHVVRGGNFVYGISDTRFSYRVADKSDKRSVIYGLRLVREPLP